MNPDKKKQMVLGAMRLNQRAISLSAEAKFQASEREANRLFYRSMLANRGANRLLKICGVLAQ